MKRFVSVIISFMMIFSTAIFSVGAENNDTRATKSKAIVIIPGIAGSKLQNSSSQVVWLSTANPGRMTQLECNENGASVNSISTISNDTDGVLNTGKELYDALESAYSNSYDIIFFSYDWRMSCSAAASLLSTKLSSYNEVIIVAHSMGGLVASKYLATSNSNRNKVSKFISIGTPYTGSAKALHMMETGEFIKIPVINISPYKNTIKSLVCNFSAIYELLPTSRYFTNNTGYIKTGTTLLSNHTDSWNFMKAREWGKKSNGSSKTMFSNATSFHNSLLVNGTHVANGGLVDTYKIYGKGEDTISRIIYASDGTISISVVNTGDGTVCIQSATNTLGANGSKVYGFNAKHLELIKDTGVINKVKSIINGTTTASSFSNGTSSINVNEKGWIIGENNKRTNIMIYNGSLVDIYNSKGEKLLIDGNTVYYNEGEKKIEVGSIWSLGQDSFQFVLYDDEYIVDVDKISTKNITVKIEYSDSGYYTKSATFNNINTSSRITTTSSDSKDIKVTDNQGKEYVATKNLTKAELELLNN